MLDKRDEPFLDFNKNTSRILKVSREINALNDDFEKKENSEDRKLIETQIKSLKNELKKISRDNLVILDKISLVNPLNNYGLKGETKTSAPQAKEVGEISKNKMLSSKTGFFGKLFGMNPQKLSTLEKETLGRLKEQEGEDRRVEKKGLKKPSVYIRKANQLFSETSSNLMRKWGFKELQSSLVKSNMNFLLKSYISVILLTTLISFIASIGIFAFFMFFSLQSAAPFITQSAESLLTRAAKTIWIIFIAPLGVGAFMYFYPSMEEDSIGKKIEVELPFATINMAAISGSMIDPTKIFSIIISTHEYPYLEREFKKLLNSINVLGYDFITALRNTTFTTASKKLAQLFNGLATTISSGGDLPKFFQERANGMLFEYNLEREKGTRAAETFMDIYISVVIAAPMILMLLLMMMRISGLGVPLSSAAITLIMILGVTAINISFLVFLHLKQSNA